MEQKVADIATIGRISAVPAMLKVISDMTGLRFAAPTTPGPHAPCSTS